MIDSIDKLNKLMKNAKTASLAGPDTKILVSLGTCGIASGGKPVFDALKKEVERQGKAISVEIGDTGCMGLCHSEPTIEIIDKKNGESKIYGNIKAGQAAGIIEAGTGTINGLEAIERTWYYPEEEENINNALQAKVVLKNTGRIDPEKIEDYIAANGYQGLAKALFMTPEKIISIVESSGLRGRGGGGFPTGKKWGFAAAQKQKEKFVICNADEGDPGAFMDRAVLEGDPHAVLEAMTITGFAIGSNHGIIYIRAEYPLAIKRLEIAISQSEKEGLLGKDILGSGFNFDIEIKYGAGAFVCGEETALIRSIEGMRGEPTSRPPFPAVEGLWQKPTIVNNVETYANVCAILRNGAEWFRKLGTESSPGTKVFALAGKIDKVGLIEVPMGTTLRDIIFSLGNGCSNGKKFKAVQTGGPSGGAISADEIDTPIDYDSLIALGSMMGSGGMIVLDEDDCMVNIAKFFIDFTMDESCGKCTPCRVGGQQMFKILEKITEGTAKMEDIELLKRIANTVKKTSLCGLGQTSPNPVLSTLSTFEDEYIAHIKDKKCPAGVCEKLLSYEINEDCVGCTICAQKCPADCISGIKKEQHTIDQKKCIKCGACYDVCKFNAVIKK
ncbi:NADH-quinone oxidoreductase subunit NuoF [bacterium]|nr:NADH-quinone oxidoreductase subunit NuoF [bacterium]